MSRNVALNNRKIAIIRQDPNIRDVCAMIERLDKLFQEKESYSKFLASRGASAQELLDLLQDLLDYDSNLARRDRRRLFKALIRLSRDSKLHPRCFTIPALEQGKLVAGGSFGDVYKGLLEGQSVAVKMMRVFEGSDIDALQKEFGREALIWRQLCHPNLLPFFGLYYFQERLCLVSPWMEKGHIRAFLKNETCDRDRLLSLILDVALGLQHLHENGVVHGDFKADNIFITPSGRACIGDFGLSSTITTTSSLQFANSSRGGQGGTIRYQAPELLQGERNDLHSDIYSFACVVYEMLTGKLPFSELFMDVAVIKAVLDGRRPSRPTWCSGTSSLDSLWNLLQHCWDGQPVMRPTAVQIVEQLLGPDIQATKIQSAPDWDDRFTSRFRRHLLGQRPLSLGLVEFERMIFGDVVQSKNPVELTHQMYKNFPKRAINEDGKLLNRNPKKDAEELEEHPCFSPIDLAALVRKQLTQPFEPIVESDELTTNFDETSTSANLHGLRLADMDFGFEEEGPSEDWVALAGSVSGHPPNRAWPRPQRMNIKPKSIHVPDFKMQPPLKPHLQNMSPASQASPAPQHSPGSSSKGLIHVKLIQARALHVRSSSARPYVVVQFEQNEFISRDPTNEADKEVKGIPSSAMSALSAIAAKAAATAEARRRGSKASSSVPSASTLSNGNGLFGQISAHNPVWKQEVSFDVTSEASLITFNVYDRTVVDHGFLGTVQIKPVLIHDYTVDAWYKLNEVVSGEMRVYVTFEQYKTKRALTPRDFEFLKLIGRGTFGKVFQVRKKDTKRIYAMKVLSKKEIVAKKEVAHTIGERKILQRSLESPFLVGLKFSFETDADLYLVTDFKSGGELFWHLQRETRFSEERARFYIAELILAFEHLHKYDIVYRDLKPENILLDATGHVALCGFGLSKPDLRSDELTTTFCGTTEYLAPEVLLDEHGYSKMVDFWSLGVLLFEMCCGWSPFYAEDIQQTYKNICFGKIRFPKGAISEDGRQFVRGLLNRNPKHRLGAVRDVEELKEHPFFSSIDWAALARKEVMPPFKPVVESDESTANFDEIFTSANLHDVGLADMDLDIDERLPEDWIALAGSVSGHQPDRVRPQPQGIAIKLKENQNTEPTMGRPLKTIRWFDDDV